MIHTHVQVDPTAVAGVRAGKREKGKVKEFEVLAFDSYGDGSLVISFSEDQMDEIVKAYQALR